MTKNTNNNDYTKSNNAKDTKVAIFTNFYGRKKLTNEWENTMFRECQIKGYEIVAEFRYNKKICISKLYENIKKEYDKHKFKKIIVIDFREICLNALKLISLVEMLKDLGIEIEIVNCTYLLDEILSYNVFLQTYFYDDGDWKQVCYYDEDDYFHFMEELEYQRTLEIIRLNQNGKIEHKWINADDDDELAMEDTEWRAY